MQACVAAALGPTACAQWSKQQDTPIGIQQYFTIFEWVKKINIDVPRSAGYSSTEDTLPFLTYLFIWNIM